MSVIKAITADQSLNIKNLPVMSSGGVGTDSLLVTFDKSWTIEGTERFANFFRNTADDGVAVSLNCQTENKYTCTIPAEFLASEGLFHFAVFAKNPSGTVIKTSTVCNVKVLPGAFTGAPVQIDWQGFYNQLVGVLNENFNANLATDADFDTVIDFIRKIEDGGELWEWIIWLLNTTQMVVDEGMTREEVQNVVSEYNNSLHSQLFDFSEFINTVCDAVKTIIPDFVEPADSTFAALAYATAIKEYAETHVPKFELDAVQDEVISLQDSNDAILKKLYYFYKGA